MAGLAGVQQGGLFPADFQWPVLSPFAAGRRA
jgi:hypothetical protein